MVTHKTKFAFDQKLQPTEGAFRFLLEEEVEDLRKFGGYSISSITIFRSDLDSDPVYNVYTEFPEICSEWGESDLELYSVKGETQCPDSMEH